MYQCSRCGGTFGEKRGICPRCGCHLWYDGKKSGESLSEDAQSALGCLILLGLAGLVALVLWLWPNLFRSQPDKPMSPENKILHPAPLPPPDFGKKEILGKETEPPAKPPNAPPPSGNP
jgi:hypothetical protein